MELEENKIQWIRMSGRRYPQDAFVAGSDSGNNIYVIRAFYQGAQVPGKLYSSHPYAYVPYGCKEQKVKDYEVLVAQRFSLRWVSNSDGYVPYDAVEGGFESDGEIYYIGRVKYKGVTTVGKIHPSLGGCFIPYNGEEIHCKQYEVLQSLHPTTGKSKVELSQWGNEVQWIPMSGGRHPTNAFVAGNDSGSIVYVVRASYQGYWVPGKLHASHQCAYIPYDSKELKVNEYEVLVAADSSLCWASNIRGHVPFRAVKGGSEKSGESNYIGRVTINGAVTVGKIDPNLGVCYVPYGGKELRFKHYEVLEVRRKTPTVFLTVSSIAERKNGELKDRMIEINWNYLEPQSGDWVGLFDHEPDENGTEPLYWVLVGNLPRGYIKSDYRLPRLPLTDRVDPCLGFWIALIRDRRVVLRNCLRIYPKWMKENRNIIGDMPLSSLIIPGTHNSGSWREYEGPASEPFLGRYLINQDEPVYRQLMHGIRYLDIRVGFYPETKEKFWINHDSYRMRALSEITQDVKRFVEETGEVVILDFHRFPVGFEGQRSTHAQLVEYIHSQLGPHLVPNSLWPHGTPNAIWNINKSVIISYSDTQTAQQYPYLWPPLPQEWGDKQTLPELKEFLGDSLKKRGGKGWLWAAMAEFTPRWYMFLSPTGCLRNMAQTVNIPMTYWFQDRTWNSKSNIIATDFFLGNNIIQSSINSNTNGFQCTP